MAMSRLLNPKRADRRGLGIDTVGRRDGAPKGGGKLGPRPSHHRRAQSP